MEPMDTEYTGASSGIVADYLCPPKARAQKLTGGHLFGKRQRFCDVAKCLPFQAATECRVRAGRRVRAAPDRRVGLILSGLKRRDQFGYIESAFAIKQCPTNHAVGVTARRAPTD